MAVTKNKPMQSKSTPVVAQKASTKFTKKQIVEEIEEESEEEEEEFDEEEGSEEEDDEDEDDAEDDAEDDEEDGDDEDDDEDGDDMEEYDEDGPEVDEEDDNAMQIERSRREDIVDDLHYDPYNLLVCNYHPLNVDPSMETNRIVNDKFEKLVVEQTTRAAQLLYQKLHSYPTEMEDVGPVTILPSETTLLPRTHKIPEPKPETKWEKFAREKGIKKKKKERMVYDEQTQEFKPRFGYKRINNGLEDIPIVEVKQGQDPYADPWEEDRKNKKERIDKNKKNQLQNMKKAQHILNKKNPNKFDSATIPGIPVEFNPKTSGNNKRGKQGLKKTLQLVQNSTQSLGRYDDVRPGEPTRKLITKTKKMRDNMAPLATDKQLMKETLRFVSNKKEKKEKGITNSLSMYEGIIPDAPENKFKKTKGKGKGKGKK